MKLNSPTTSCPTEFGQRIRDTVELEIFVQTFQTRARSCFEETDWATWNLLQWFVKEQIEEETLAMDMIDRSKIVGGDRASNESLNCLDREFRKMEDDATLVRDAPEEYPG